MVTIEVNLPVTGHYILPVRSKINPFDTFDIYQEETKQWNISEIDCKLFNDA